MQRDRHSAIFALKNKEMHMKILNFLTRKMWRNKKDDATPEAHDVLLRERLEKVEGQIARLQATDPAPSKNRKTEAATARSRHEERQQAMLLPIHDMAQYVMDHYEFRHNVLRDVYEYRSKTAQPREWTIVDKRQLNSINCQIQDNGEIFCLSSYVRQRIESNLAVDYHPVREYLNRIRGLWDGQTDYIGDLARRISTSDYCQRMVRIWLRAVVVQWLGLDQLHANAVMLLLISKQQGLGKSTLFTSLLPRELAEYYTDDIDLKQKGNAPRKMVEFAMVSLDEFEKLGRKKMPHLKSLMQTLKPAYIGSYKKNFNQLPRIASFVGTTNERHVLTDRTGSRRFLILEPDGMIDVNGIQHDQLYAQVMHEVEVEHLPHWFSKDDEAEMERQNQRYYVLSDVEQLFMRYFRTPDENEQGQFMTGAEIIRELAKHSPKTMAGVTTNAFGRSMTRLGVKRVSRHETDGYVLIEN